MKAKKIEPDINFREVTMKYGRLVIFIRHDPAEIWMFTYGLTLVMRKPPCKGEKAVWRRPGFSGRAALGFYQT
jgi:hypothetical protein